MSEPYMLPLELALIRWSAAHIRWNDLANDCPNLTAFLAGWCCRCAGTTEPEDLGQFRDSFRAGWKEADDSIAIARRYGSEQGLTAPGGEVGA